MTPRRLSQLGFFLGLAAGALAFALFGAHEVAFVCFVVTWYALAYGVPRATAHPEHRPAWVAHIVLFPVTWVIAVVAIWLALGNPVAAILLGAALALALQAVVTTIVLRSVRSDQRHDLRRRLGLE